MAKVAVFFVSCKEDPEKKLQTWVPHMSMIYSQCSHCQALTGYDQVNKQEHYDFYEITVKKEKGMTYEDVYAKAEELANADKTKYQVKEHSDKCELEGKKPRIKSF